MEPSTIVSVQTFRTRAQLRKEVFKISEKLKMPTVVITDDSLIKLKVIESEKSYLTNFLIGWDFSKDHNTLKGLLFTLKRIKDTESWNQINKNRPYNQLELRRLHGPRLIIFDSLPSTDSFIVDQYFEQNKHENLTIIKMEVD